MCVMFVRAPLRRSLVSLLVVGCVAACVGSDPSSGGTSTDGGIVVANDASSPTEEGGGPGPTPTKPKPLGEVCSSAGECESGFCADGVCCDTACGGQCEACAGATKGTCTRVTGIPIAPRPPCTGAGTSCGGTCSGASSCTYVAAATICGASCGGTCDGAGTCSDTGGGACPDGFACQSAGQCKTTCTVKADCQPNFDCDLADSKCKRIPESDCFDNADNNGDGLADCQDPTCIGTAAACVAAVGAGATIGTVVEQLPCPAGFAGATQNLNQGLQPGSCSGCSCKTQCSVTLRTYAGADCSSTSTSISYTATQGDNQACQNTTDANRLSQKISSITKSGCAGSGTNTWTAATPAWTTSKVFCTQSRSSPTCGQNQLCVPKVASGIASKVAAGGACPVGYTGGEATYYPTYSNGVCGLCSSCTAGTNFNCGSIGFSLDADNACGGAAQLIGANISNYTTTCNNFGGSLNIKSMKLSILGNGDDCVKNSSIATPAAATNGQLVCTFP
jgi:hypothetical protein